MKSGNLVVKGKKSGTCVLVEGPAWGDADFYGRWLLDAAKANELLQQAKSGNRDLSEAVGSIEAYNRLDFGIMATVFVSQFTDKAFSTFVIDGSSLNGFEDLIDFVLMAEMGFFTLTGDRYQMTMPPNLDMDRVVKAHLKLAGTCDDDWSHPEQLVVGISCARAKKYQRLLRHMNQGERLANRRALLFLD